MHEKKQPEQGPNVGRRRRRLLAHLGIFAAAGLALVTLGPSSTSAAPAVQDGRFLTAGQLVVPYDCAGADIPSQNLLVGILPATGGTFILGVTIVTAAVEPAPSPGDTFEMDFIYNQVLPQNLVEVAVGVGSTELDTAGVNTIIAVEGATGDPAVITGSTIIPLGDGTLPVGFTFTGQGFEFTRTAAVDEPIKFSPQQILGETLTSLGILVKIKCDPQDASLVLEVNDETGVPPETTTTTLPPIVPVTVTTPPATVQGDTVDTLPRTGSGTSNLYLVLLALGLLDMGYLALTAGNSPRMRRASSVR